MSAAEENGQAPRVSINPDRPEQTIDLATITAMVQRWRARNPAQFGYWLAEALTGAAPSKSAREPDRG